jgi:TctA family transporter
MLLARGSLGLASRPTRWRLWQIVPLMAAVALMVAGLVLWFGSIDPSDPLRHMPSLLLLFGPAEYVATVLLVLSVAIAFARLSRLRAAGMVLLGLLLWVVGGDVASTGEPRLTIGLEELVAGILFEALAVGLICVADSMLGVFSPALALATYTRRISGWRDPVVSTAVASGMRIAAVLAFVGTFYLLQLYLEDVVDIALALLFAVLGVACKLLGWNRSVLLLGFASSPLLERGMLQSLMLVGGDLTYYFSAPLSAALLIASGAALTTAMGLSLHRAVTRNATARAEPA